MVIDRRAFLWGALAALTAPSLRAAPPRRIATLEWMATEIAVSLGSRPVGAADVEGYRRWVSIGNDMLDDAVDLGTRQQPSMEALKRLRPDVILSSVLRHRGLEAKLSEIAPTVLIEDQPATGDLLGAVYDCTKAVGDALGVPPAAARLLADFDAKQGALTEEAKQASLAGLRLLVAQPLPGVPRLRIFTPNSAVMRLLERSGFAAALDLPAEPFGFTTIGLEALASVDGSARLVLLSDSAPAELAESALWPMLPVVASGGLVSAGAANWPFGGPASLLRLLSNVVGRLQA